MSYQATICKLSNITSHPNANRLKLAEACGTTVIVGLDANENDLMIFFSADGQLSERFCEVNNLIGKTDPVTGIRTGGLFDSKRRVRAQNLRGIKSEAFVCEISYLEALGINTSKLKVGDSFTELEGIPICNKYMTPATLKAANIQNSLPKKEKLKPKVTHIFPKHFDTSQYKVFKNSIPGDSIIYISAKLHGTSQRLGNVLEITKLPLPWYKRFLSRLGFKFQREETQQYKELIGTRNVILKEQQADNFYKEDKFRSKWLNLVRGKLHKGEVIYGEIVGYTDSGKQIMPSHSTDAVKDKAFSKKYGKSVTYKYGCPEGTSDFYVYRISMVNLDGVEIDLAWPDVVRRCRELELKTVPVLERLVFNQDLSQGLFINEENKNLLDETINKFLDKESVLDSSHIEEGLCIRYESSVTMNILKLKAWAFLVMEGILKDQEDYVDLEESS